MTLIDKERIPKYSAKHRPQRSSHTITKNTIMATSTLLISTTPAPPSSGTVPAPGLSLYNLHPPTQTLAFKKTSIPANALAVGGGYIFGIQHGSAVLHVFGREKLGLELTVPFTEQLTAGAVNKGGTTFVGGNERGQILVWELATGHFLRTSAWHHQKISHLAFTEDGSLVLSGSPDSSIHVWSVLSLLTPSSTPAKPIKTLTNHTRPLTALLPSHPSHGPTAFILSAAEDSLVLLTSLTTFRPLRTLCFDTPPTSLTLDPLDRALYAGFKSGDIVVVDLLSISADTPGTTPLFVGRETKWARWFNVPTSNKEAKEKVTGVTGKKKEEKEEDRTITALALSYEGTRLYSGDGRGEVSEWDAALGICKRTFVNLKSPITGLFLETELAGRKTEKERTIKIPNLGKPAFHKPRDPVLQSVLSVEFTGDLTSLPTPTSTSELIEDGLAEIMAWGGNGAVSSGAVGGVGDSLRVKELEEELERWKKVARGERETREKVWKSYVKLALEKGGEDVEMES